jgi:hypothetical protein
MKHKPTNITVTPAPEILSAAINEAIKPMREELRTAAQQDDRLDAEAAKYHPTKAREEWQRLHERALDGDEEAAAVITQHGGAEHYVANVSAPYHLRDGMRKRHAEGCAGLFLRMTQAVIPAVREAGAQIQRQFEDVTQHMGELPGGVSQWDTRVRAMVANLEKLPQQAALGTGPAWLLRENGLGEAVGL